ncbi:MAG TPA: HD domain-containing protein [Spirochaetia bacterium]|nr:HD domain-containing protein [Spirochaetia bacterium]
MVELALEAYGLKDTLRTGWVLRGIRNPESVADHSWGTAFLCMLFGPEAGVDVGIACRIALIHDIAECRTGDIPTRVEQSGRSFAAIEKSTAERQAMDELVRLANGEVGPAGDGFADLWQLYEDRASPEAIFVRDMNLIDMCLQAYLYERGRRYDPETGAENFPRFARLDEFFATSGPRIATPVGRRLYDEIHARYRAVSTSGSE